MLKRVLAALLCSTVVAAGFTGCGKQIVVDESDSSADKSQSSDASGNVQHEINISRFKDRSVPQIDLEASEIKNFTPLEKGDQIIVMTIKGYGEVKIRLFPEYASKGVENFVELAKQGYYDGLTFHRVISDFMIQGGDPLGNGTGGESIWGGKFEGGTDSHVIHAAGAIAYANSGATSTNGSQFYIVTGTVFAEEQFPAGYPEDWKEVYKTAGGTPHLDGGYTVFGQVFDGLDVVFTAQDVTTDAHTAVDPNFASNKPVDDLIIESVEVAEYNGEELKWFIADYQ